MFALGFPNFRVPTGPFAVRDKTITPDGTVTPRDVLAMYRSAHDLNAAEQVALNRALGRLVARTLRPRLRVIDTTGLRELSGRDRSPATVIDTGPDRITVPTEGGAVNSITKDFLTWSGQTQPTLTERRRRCRGLRMQDRR